MPAPMQIEGIYRTYKFNRLKKNNQMSTKNAFKGDLNRTKS